MAVLSEANMPLEMGEIVKRIKNKDRSVLKGMTPEKSLYSVIYRRERRRAERGYKRLIKQIKDRGKALYLIEDRRSKNIGIKIEHPLHV